jgi:hypothetical protein
MRSSRKVVDIKVRCADPVFTMSAFMADKPIGSLLLKQILMTGFRIRKLQINLNLIFRKICDNRKFYLHPLTSNSFLKGSSLSLTPVAMNTALATAGATDGKTGSPTPPALRVLLAICTSISGTSDMVSTG